MKISLFVILIILSLCTNSCQSVTGPSGGVPITPSALSLFVWKTGKIYLQVPQPSSKGVYPDVYEHNDWLSSYCWLHADFTDTLRDSIVIYLSPRIVTPGPISGHIAIRLGDNIIYQPATINVMDFYYVHRLENNTNDTIKLKSGISFLLQLTCRDSADNILSFQQVGRLLDGNIGGGRLVFPYAYYTYDAIYCDNYYKDTTSYYYVLSTVPNVTFSSRDTGQYFEMDISNRAFKIPIRLVN